MVKNNRVGDNIFKNIWFAFKRNIFLILAIIVFCTALGGVYTMMQKPQYRATEKVICKTANDIDNGPSSDLTTAINYIKTIIDFADEGVVIDRANWYYSNYCDKKGTTQANITINSVDKFIEYMNIPGNDTYQSSDQPGSELEIEQEILRSNLVVNTKTTAEGDVALAFSISYIDEDKEDAKEKARIYVYAFQREISAENGVQEGKYFDGIRSIDIVKLGSIGTVSTVSKTKNVVFAFGVGLAIAIAVVYIISITDSSVKSKEELEFISGVGVLSYIVDVEDRK